MHPLATHLVPVEVLNDKGWTSQCLKQRYLLLKNEVASAAFEHGVLLLLNNEDYIAAHSP